MIPEVLSVGLPDDLPPVPLTRGSDGSISFFATGNISVMSSTGSPSMLYSHSINPYGDTSYYFLSDVKPETETSAVDLSDTEGLTVFLNITNKQIQIILRDFKAAVS